MAKKKNYKLLLALAVLAVAALVSSTVAITNVTYWLVNATTPPAMKYASPDANVGGGQYVKVSYYYDSQNAINITRISVVGFTGDPVNYTKVARVCNHYGNQPVKAKLVWRGIVQGSLYQDYVKAFVVYWTGPTTTPNQVGFVGGTTYAKSGAVTIGQGQCADVGVHVRIAPDLPAAAANGKTILATYQVDIQFEID